MNKQEIILNEERNVSLTVYLQAVGGEFSNVAKRPAVLILPGGGYTMCSEREADLVAFPYLAAGYQAFILRYSVGHNAIWPAPLEDLEHAMDYIRARAEEWDLYGDKLAVIGFSAGGHLAGCAATMVKERANAAILGYAAVMGETIQACSPTAPDVVSAVDDETCPCFLFASRTDNVVPVQNTLAMVQALTAHDISYECHIYAYGPHGFSTGVSAVMQPGSVMCSRVPNWVADSIAWLKDVFGDFSTGSMSEPACGSHINGNHEPVLNVDCTVAYLQSKPEAACVVAPLMSASSEKYGAHIAKPSDVRDPSMSNSKLGELMTLRDILTYGNLPGDVIEGLDRQLRQIPNSK